MFGFRRRAWKHAHREEIAYLKELVAVGCLLALIMGVLGFLGERAELARRDGEPAFVVAGDPMAEVSPADRVTTPPPVASTKDDPTPPKVVEPVEPLVAEPASVEPVVVPPAAKPAAVELVPDEPEFVGIDPLATPEVFDRFDRVDRPDSPEALDALGAVVAHVPSVWNLPAQRRETPVPRLHVVVDKAGHTLTLFRGGEVLRQYGVAVGANTGDKVRAGDNRTPEGSFPVQQIHNAEHWVHDFGDGNGVIEGAYGPLFIRLATPPWKGIGIHGTHDPDSIGTNATEGCVRMRNDDLLEFAEMMEIGTTVTIR